MVARADPFLNRPPRLADSVDVTVTPLAPAQEPAPNPTLGATLDRVLVSAHRGGVGRDRQAENTRAAFEAAVRLPCEFVEFDVQRTRDGQFLIHHDQHVRLLGVRRSVADLTAAEVDAAAGPRVRLAEIVHLLARHQKQAHVDLKFRSPASLLASDGPAWEVEAAEIVLAGLGPDQAVFTTVEDVSVRALHDWAARTGQPVRCGLTLGRRLHGLTWREAARVRLGEIFPGRRVRSSGANLIVAQRHLARFRLLGWAAAREIPVLVWTVDNQKEMQRLLADPRVWLVTSNRPMEVMALRHATEARAVARQQGPAGAVPLDAPAAGAERAA